MVVESKLTDSPFAGLCLLQLEDTESSSIDLYDLFDSFRSIEMNLAHPPLSGAEEEVRLFQQYESGEVAKKALKNQDLTDQERVRLEADFQAGLQARKD